MLLVGSSWMSAGLCCSMPQCWLLRLPVRSQMGGSGLSCPRFTQPVWPACWVDTPDWSFSSSSKVVQDVWDICKEELGTVPPDLILALRSPSYANSVDQFWSVWSAGAEAGLLGAYRRAGGLVTSGVLAFLGQGALQVRRRRLGGRAVGGGAALYRASRGDEVGVASA